MSHEHAFQNHFQPLIVAPPACADAGAHAWLAGLMPGAYVLPRPPRSLQPVHDPAFVERWLRAIVGALVQPVEVCQLEGHRCVHILGQAVFARDAEGLWHCYLWEVIDGRAALELAPPSQVVIDGAPYRWHWLDRFEHVFAEALRKQHPQSRARAAGYASWVFQCFRARLRRGHLLQHARRRIAEALDLDPQVLGLARRAALRTDNSVRAWDYNRVVRYRAHLEKVAAEAPRLLSTCFAWLDDIEADVEPAAALRRIFIRGGVSPAAWRLLHQQGVRRLKPLLEFYSCDTAAALLDLLRIVGGLGATQIPPTWLLRSMLYRFGNFGQRRHTYCARLAGLMPSLRRITALAERAGTAETAAMKEGIYRVVSWLSEDESAMRHGQARKATWRWFERRSAEWQEREGERARGNDVVWPAPFHELRFEQHRVVALRTRFALWEEGRQMRHCAASLAARCERGETLLASVRREGRERPVATLRLDRHGDRWVIAQVAGCANTPPAPHVVRFALMTVRFVNHLRWGLKEEPARDPAHGLA
jgi:hypothetical protein